MFTHLLVTRLTTAQGRKGRGGEGGGEGRGEGGEGRGRGGEREGRGEGGEREGGINEALTVPYIPAGWPSHVTHL